MKNSGAFIILIFCLAQGNGQDSVSFLDPNCGVSKSEANNNNNSKATYRIIGGGIADMYGNPWMAFITTIYLCIEYPGSNCIGGCGGSLITPRFVLSAAHCRFTQNTTILLGTIDRSQRSTDAIEVPANAQIRHPFYSKRDKDIKHDIALYRLAWAVTYTEYIRPICLATNYNYLEQTTYLTATGWGRTEFDVLSNVLMTTTLTQHDRKICSLVFGKVDMSQICAGSYESQTCKGDSGGPVTSVYNLNGTNRVIQLGIVSYGGTECRTVGVLTNVNYYINWIVEIAVQGKARTTPSPAYV